MTDAGELIDRLCTVAGMIPEDIHEVALARDASAATPDRIAMIQAAAGDITMLARAAQVIQSRFS